MGFGWVICLTLLELNMKSTCRVDLSKIHFKFLLPVKCHGKHIFSEEGTIWKGLPRSADLRKSVWKFPYY